MKGQPTLHWTASSGGGAHAKHSPRPMTRRAAVADAASFVKVARLYEAPHDAGATTARHVRRILSMSADEQAARYEGHCLDDETRTTLFPLTGYTVRRVFRRIRRDDA